MAHRVVPVRLRPRSSNRSGRLVRMPPRFRLREAVSEEKGRETRRVKGRNEARRREKRKKRENHRPKCRRGRRSRGGRGERRRPFTRSMLNTVWPVPLLASPLSLLKGKRSSCADRRGYLTLKAAVHRGRSRVVSCRFLGSAVVLFVFPKRGICICICVWSFLLS